jgi:hypothetical protein
MALVAHPRISPLRRKVISLLHIAVAKLQERRGFPVRRTACANRDDKHQSKRENHEQPAHSAHNTRQSGYTEAKMIVQEQESNLEKTVRVRIGGQPCALALNTERLKERLVALGHSGNIRAEWTAGINPGEYFQEESATDEKSGTDVVCLNPHFIVLVRMGLFPLPWPAALCPAPLYRKRLLQTLAHELRHAQQTAGITDVTEKQPWLSYVVLRNLGRAYILLALLGALAIQQLLGREALLPAVIIGGGLIALALVYILLAYLNYHLDPLEVDARAYERKNWQEWEDCLQFNPCSNP